MRQKNDVPIVFVGSSKESLPVARIVRDVLNQVADVRIWDKDVFHVDEFILESLEHQADKVDYAVPVFGPDDRLFSRKRDYVAPRDNVVLEMGIFIGALGSKRAFVIKPKKKNLKMPTDLLGKNYIEYVVAPNRPKHLAIKEACADLVKTIKREGAI